VRNSLRAHVGDIDAAAVPCGFGRAIGNKVLLAWSLTTACDHLLFNWSGLKQFYSPESENWRQGGIG